MPANPDLGPWTPTQRPTTAQTIRRERFVRRAREHGLTMRAIAGVLGVTRERVRQIESSGRRRYWRIRAAHERRRHALICWSMSGDEWRSPVSHS